MNILGLLKRKEWHQCHRESSWQVCESSLCQKGKEQSRLSRAPDRKEGIQCQRCIKKQQQRKDKETSIPLQKDSESQSKKLSHPNKLSKKSRETFVGAKDRRKRDSLAKLVGDQNPGPETPPKSKTARERREKRRCRERSDCQKSDGEE